MRHRFNDVYKTSQSCSAAGGQHKGLIDSRTGHNRDVRPLSGLCTDQGRILQLLMLRLEGAIGLNFNQDSPSDKDSLEIGEREISGFHYFNGLTVT